MAAVIDHSGAEFREIGKSEWEASPYANVHKFNHDTAPARAALGSGGCTDCHATGSHFFTQPALLLWVLIVLTGACGAMVEMAEMGSVITH